MEIKTGKLIEFKVSELPNVLLVGKELRHSMEEQMKGNNPLPYFWDSCFADETFSILEKQSEFVYNAAYVGVMIDWDKGDGKFSYIVGILMKPGADVPEGFVSRTIDATRVAIGLIQGKDAQDVCSKAHEVTEQALKADGYSNNGMKWCMELYNCPRFTTPDKNDEIVLDYYIPID